MNDVELPEKFYFRARPAGEPVRENLVVFGDSVCIGSLVSKADAKIVGGYSAGADDWCVVLGRLVVICLVHELERQDVVDLFVDLHEDVPFFFRALFDDAEYPVADARACDQLPGVTGLGVEDVDTEPGEDTNGRFRVVEEERVREEDTSSIRKESSHAGFRGPVFGS